MEHFARLASDGRPAQLLLQVDGRAGTGKSHLLMVLSAKLQEMADDLGRPQPIVRTAPTGVAAHGIRGRTLHALFRLPVRSGFAPLSASNLAAVQASLRHCEYLVIDEKSMISQRQLGWLDQRCRQIRPHHAEQHFGGFSVILMGDFYQLPPVLGRPLYNTKPTRDPDELMGRLAYDQFRQTVELSIVMRQQGTDSDALRFRAALDHLRISEMTRVDWETLVTRVCSNLTAQEQTSFDSALRIFAKKEAVAQVNHARLRGTGQPVRAIQATHDGPQAHNASTSEAGNLEAELRLCLGARVMLLENLWTERGLVNGAMGTVRDIVWTCGSDWLSEPPLAVLVAFDNYDGPAIEHAGTEKIVPVFRSRREFFRGGTTLARKQFPLTVSYAVTIHKAQGMTVDRAVLNLAEPDFALGLSYVALSRVKTLRGVMFEETFDFDRFKASRGEMGTMRDADAVKRRPQII